MVVYGLLTYNQAVGQISIPSRELMLKFNDLLMSNENFGIDHTPDEAIRQIRDKNMLCASEENWVSHYKIFPPVRLLIQQPACIAINSMQADHWIATVQGKSFPYDVSRAGFRYV